jgi:hypothetical protein
MSYRSLHKSIESFELSVLWALVGAFLLALAMMFIHPSVSLLIFWLGLVGVGLAALTVRWATKAARRQARESLHRHECPECGAWIERGGRGAWSCHACGCGFSDQGAEQPAEG